MYKWAEETRTVTWHGEPFVMVEADYQDMALLWKAAKVMPDGPARTARLRELDLLMGLFETFPGTYLVR